MAKLFVISTFILCLGVAMAAEGDSNPVKGMQGMFRKVMNSMNPVKACAPSCSGWCKLVDEICRDMKKDDPSSCVKSNTECGETCATVCGCMEDCSKNCDATESCEGLDEIEAEGCMIRKAACSDECAPQCPLDFFPKYYGGEIKSMEEAIGRMMPSVYQGMIDLEDQP